MDKNSLMDQLDRAVGAHGPVLVKISVFGQPVWLDITGVVLSHPDDPPSVDHAIILTTSVTPRAAAQGTGPGSLPVTVLGPQGVQNQDQWEQDPLRPQRPISPPVPERINPVVPASWLDPEPKAPFRVKDISQSAGWTDDELAAAGILPGTPQDQLVPGLEGRPERIKIRNHPVIPERTFPPEPERRYAEPDFRHREVTFPERPADLPPEHPNAPLAGQDIQFPAPGPMGPMEPQEKPDFRPGKDWTSDLIIPEEPATRSIEPGKAPQPYRPAHPRIGDSIWRDPATTRVVENSPFLRDEASHAFAGSEEITTPEMERDSQDPAESIYDGLGEDNLPEGQS